MGSANEDYVLGKLYNHGYKISTIANSQTVVGVDRGDGTIQFYEIDIYGCEAEIYHDIYKITISTTSILIMMYYDGCDLFCLSGTRIISKSLYDMIMSVVRQLSDLMIYGA